MSLSSQRNGSYSALANCAEFLLNNHIDALTTENILLARSLDLPILKILVRLSENDLFNLSKEGLTKFLGSIANERAIEETKESIEQWKLNQLPNINKKEISGADLVLIYSIRKRIIVKFLSYYTTDGNLILAIVNELEELFAQMEVLAYEAFVTIQQEELKIQKEFSDSINENSVDGIFAFDLNLTITSWNKAMEEKNKLKRENVIGKKILEVFPAYERLVNEVILQRVFKGERIAIPERPYTKREGFFEGNLVPLYGKDNKVSGGIIFIHDVTERHKAEEGLKVYQAELEETNEELKITNEELRESQEELVAANEELRENMDTIIEMQEALVLAKKGLIEAQAIAHLGSWEWDLVENVIAWSDEMYNLYGYKPGEVVLDFDTYLSHIHPFDRELAKSSVETCMSNHKPYIFDHRIIKKDGETRWLMAKGRITEFREGKVAKMGGIAFDITEQKRAQETIIKSRDFYLTILEDFPAMIWRCGLDTKCDYVNKTWLDFTGRTFEEEIGDNYRENIYPGDQEKTYQLFMNSFETKTPFQQEYKLRRKDGKYKWIINFGKPLYDIHGEFEGFIGACYDIDDKKEKEKELNTAYFDIKQAHEELMRTQELLKEMNNELEERVMKRTLELQSKNADLLKINEDLDNFVYTASHDLKAPIANLELLIQSLRKRLKDKMDNSLIKIFDMIGISISKFTKTIQDLTEITMVQKDVSEEPEPINFSEVLDDVKVDVTKMILESGATVTDNFEIQSIVYARKNLRSIFYNLLSNALKYRSPERKSMIDFSTAQEGEYTLLIVKDNGLGISKEHQKKMFTMFKRFHSHVEGTGIGLYIVKRIIENGGGQIKVESELGEGTVFKVCFKNHSDLSKENVEERRWLSK